MKLDWSQISVSLAVSTTAIAEIVTPLLLSTSFIPELGGKALAELPIHLIGHSRGGSVVSEMARIFGQHGIWVDHVTTLDPHPVSLYNDASVYLYWNILFADNYWQTNPDLFCPNGETIFGAYNRYLSNLIGGYDCSHSDVHLWYHGTIDLNPFTSDTQANITSIDRQNWWTAYESEGTNAGFYYSLIRRGNRLSQVEPAGSGTGRISDGYNQSWDFGAGVSGNRFVLPSNDGSWPNIIKLNIAGTNTFAIGQTNSLKVFHQFGRSTADTANIQLYLDHDFNPLNSNAILINQVTVFGTGTNYVLHSLFDFTPNPATTPPGYYSVYAKMTFGGHTRYLYAPEIVLLNPSKQSPRLTPIGFQSGEFQLNVSGFTGQRVIIQSSLNFANWNSLSTNTLSGTSLIFSDIQGTNGGMRFYRAVLTQ